MIGALAENMQARTTSKARNHAPLTNAKRNDEMERANEFLAAKGPTAPPPDARAVVARRIAMGRGAAVSQGCCVDKACTEHTCMDLPAGTTCGDCVHKSRCLAFGYADSESATVCSFFPRRLRVVSTAVRP